MADDPPPPTHTDLHAHSLRQAALRHQYHHHAIKAPTPPPAGRCSRASIARGVAAAAAAAGLDARCRRGRHLVGSGGNLQGPAGRGRQAGNEAAGCRQHSSTRACACSTAPAAHKQALQAYAVVASVPIAEHPPPHACSSSTAHLLACTHPAPALPPPRPAYCGPHPASPPQAHCRGTQHVPVTIKQLGPCCRCELRCRRRCAPSAGRRAWSG